MNPENDEVAETPEAPEPPTGEPEEAAAELALDEALSGEPVTEDGDPVEPLTEDDAAAEPDAPAEPEAAAGLGEESPAEPEAPAEPQAAAGLGEESPAEPEAVADPDQPGEETVAEPEEPAEEAAAEPEGPIEEAPAEAEVPAEEAAAEPAVAAEPGPADPESGLVAAGDADALPDVTSDEALEAALEALLLIVDSPAGEELLADTLGQPKSRIVVALRTMAQKFTDRASGIDLRRVGEGWRFYTRDVYAPFVEKLLLDGQRSKLTRAALESLAVIAYRQPVTRSRVAAVRGVNVDGVIRTLLARGLIEEMGTDPETTGTLYVTTELFLERLGLSSLNDLPAIAPLLPEVDTIDDIQ